MPSREKTIRDRYAQNSQKRSDEPTDNLHFDADVFRHGSPLLSRIGRDADVFSANYSWVCDNRDANKPIASDCARPAPHAVARDEIFHP